MKKHLFVIILTISALLLCVVNASAANGTDIEPQASSYLSSYSVDLLAIGNGQMAVEMDVNAVGYMTKLGVQELYIEQKINGVWQEYDTVYGIYHSDFYAYNDYTYLGEYIFTGTAGVQYRVTMTAYARNSSGSDTGFAYTGAVTCRNP